MDAYAVWRLPVWRVVSNTPVSLAWWLQLRRIIRAERPDVINAHTPVPFMVDMATWAVGRRPVVVTYHAASLFKPGTALMTGLTRGYLAVQWLTLARARAIIAVSPYVRERQTSWQGKTTVVSNAVTECQRLATSRVPASFLLVTWCLPTAGKAWIWCLTRSRS